MRPSEHGETHIQSPAIGNALRQALSLDAAGSMGLNMDTTVIPVAVVADIRAQLGSNVRTFSCFRNVAAVAANYAKVALTVPAIPAAGGLLYAVPRQVRVRDVAGAAVYWRLGTETPPSLTDAAPRGLNTLNTAAGVAILTGGVNATAVIPAVMNGLLTQTANTITWECQEMFLRPDANLLNHLVFYSDTVNTALIVEMIWDEYYK